MEEHMIQPNPEIEMIIKSATEQTKNLNHEYVTLEHLLKALVTHQPFTDLLSWYGVDVDGLVRDLDEYLASQTFLVSSAPDTEPKKTHALERVFNRAFTQVLFSGRQHMQVIDLYVSIQAEHNSHAAYFLLK